MHSFEETRVVPYDGVLIHSVVMDIEKYPEFLPWCDSAEILVSNDEYLRAKLGLSFKIFNESYVSHVCSKFENDVYTITVDGISGPFEYLKNIWEIKMLNNCSEVKFSIAFKMKSAILDSAIGVVFSSVIKEVMDSFEKRLVMLSSQ